MEEVKFLNLKTMAEEVKFAETSNCSATLTSTESVSEVTTTVRAHVSVENEKLMETSEESRCGSAVAASRDKITEDERMDVDVLKPDQRQPPEKILTAETTLMDSASTDPLQCYCLRERNPNTVELQCFSCLRWFHESCISYQIGKCIPFMMNYTFVCKNCSNTGIEIFSKKQPNFVQMCQTVLANLMQQSIREGKPKQMFSKDKDIIPFIDVHWENLTTVSRRVKQTWHNTIYRTMMKETDMFVCQEKSPTGELNSDYPMFGLVVPEVLKIGPNYDAVSKGGQFKSMDSLKHNSGLLAGHSAVGGGVFSGKGRNAKRSSTVPINSTKKAKNDLTAPKLPPHGYPMEHPFNKDGFRYIFAEPDAHAPFRQEFDESLDWAGKPIPGWLYRSLMPPMVLLALHDRAPQLKISEDRLSVSGEKGYCMVRATHGISHGTWYYEVSIMDMPESSATRIGWSQALGNLQAPLGYDRFSYSWRSRKGTRFHESRGKHYSEGFAEGDTLGCLLRLPERHEVPTMYLPQTFKDRPLVKFKSHLYYEDKDDVQKAIKSLKPLNGSKLMFYKNGICKGVAWNDIYEGTYYPAVSLYKNIAMDQAAHEAIIEQSLSDLLYLVENDGKLRLDNFAM